MPTITIPGYTQTISIAKQSSQGTANVPSATNFNNSTGTSLRWLQGSKIRPHADEKQEQEGDGSRAVSLNFKTGQWGTGKTICYARPTDAGMLFAAFSGTGSDVKTGGWTGTTTAVSVGASGGTLTATGSSVLTAVITGTSQVTVDSGTASAETVTLATLNTGTGVYTISGTFTKAHSASAPVTIPFTHTITPATTSANSDYYTLLGTISKGSSTIRYQVVDAICYKIMASSSAANGPLKLDADWDGATNSITTGAFTTSLPTNGPFYWFNGTWSINSNLIGSNASWVSAVKELSLTFENELSPPDFIAETVTPLPMTAGNLKLTGDITLLLQDGGVDQAMYMAGGTTDTPNVVSGDLSVTFTSSTDTLQSIQIDIPAASWTVSDFDPDLSGKPIQIKASLVGLRSGLGSPYTVTVLNNANVAF